MITVLVDSKIRQIETFGTKRREDCWEICLIFDPRN